ncbi:MAG: peroxiredoxin [Acidobacteria bacterium]|nr:peroxiredoxin [Acidobacteriota bacterium]MCB9377173.1 peroxiredoxin [Holophagales bacterium]
MRSRTLPIVLLAIGGLMFFGLIGSAAELEVGATAPDISAIDQNGSSVRFADVYAQGWTLVYFYPKADTPGCTKQACSLRDAYAKLTDEGVHVIGVSNDDAASQKKFEQKYKLPFTLIADTDQKVMEAFGVPHKLGFATRQAFLVRGGKVVWRDLSASTEKQAADVLAAIAELEKQG